MPAISTRSQNCARKPARSLMKYEQNNKVILEQINKIKDINKKIYLLCIEGKENNTIEFKNEINNLMINGISTIIFVIGGSYGISDSVKNKYKYHLSFSKLTFPHQVFRCMLLEQIYRVFKIINNETYHK